MSKPKGEMTFAETLAATFEEQQKLYKGVSEHTLNLASLKKGYDDVESEHSKRSMRSQRKLKNDLQDIDKQEQQKRYWGHNKTLTLDDIKPPKTHR